MEYLSEFLVNVTRFNPTRITHRTNSAYEEDLIRHLRTKELVIIPVELLRANFIELDIPQKPILFWIPNEQTSRNETRRKNDVEFTTSRFVIRKYIFQPGSSSLGYTDKTVPSYREHLSRMKIFSLISLAEFFPTFVRL